MEFAHQALKSAEAPKKRFCFTAAFNRLSTRAASAITELRAAVLIVADAVAGPDLAAGTLLTRARQQGAEFLASFAAQAAHVDGRA